MAVSVALASLLALIATNGTSQLDCVCRCIHNETAVSKHTASVGESELWSSYCSFEVARPWSSRPPCFELLENWYHRDWAFIQPPPAGGEERECGAALAAVRELTTEEAGELRCPIADALIQSCSAQGLNDTKWTGEMLAADDLRQQLLHATRRITRALHVMRRCGQWRSWITRVSQANLTSILDPLSNHWRRAAQLIPLFSTHLSQLFIPLAYQHMGNKTNVEQLHVWIKNMERVKHMLDTQLMGLVHDVKLLSEQIANYKVEEDKDRPGKYVLRRPLLGEALMAYEVSSLSFDGDFGALCEHHLPQASEVFRLAGTLYSFCRDMLIPHWSIQNATITDEKWQQEDQSNTTVWVDTGCLQLVADAVDRPRCPLEELPLEASRQRRQCRETLWRDLVERPPRPPVTSYLAYSERAEVSLCLLAWMAANSRGVCQDVPFSIIHSVHDATCYFKSPQNQTCLHSNATDAICSISRAILLFHCRDFSSVNIPKFCSWNIFENVFYPETQDVSKVYKVYGKLTERTLSYKKNLFRATLTHKDLKHLEYSFIAVNVLFRLLTASVYLWLPHLGNLPGKILLAFQITGLVRLLYSDVLYRMVGFQYLSTVVLVDSSLTLLGYLWLNTFTYQIYACVRDLRLPNHRTPAEASMVFRRLLLWVLIPWAIVYTGCAALVGKHYLMNSIITLNRAISSLVLFNIVLLGFVAFIYFRKRKSMSRLNVIGDDKGVSKKQLIFMSVNTIILSGIWVIIIIGIHLAQGIEQYVYYVHTARMLQGPVLFVFLACNGTTIPVLKNRVLALWRPDLYSPGLELGSAAERNLARRRAEPSAAAETAL